MTDTTALTLEQIDEVIARILSARDYPYTGGIWEGPRFVQKPYVTVRGADLDALLALARQATASAEREARLRSALIDFWNFQALYPAAVPPAMAKLFEEYIDNARAVLAETKPKPKPKPKP